jgi:hypothetical protein
MAKVYIQAIVILLWAALPARAEDSPKAAAPAPQLPYTIDIAAGPDVVRGVAAPYTITLKPTEGWEIKVETPFKVKLSSKTGVKLGKTELDAKDFVDVKAREKSIATTITASTAGAHAVAASVTFFLCNATVCERYKERRELTFAVADAKK